MDTSFFYEKQLSKIGFKTVGKNVKISKKASFYHPESISLEDNIRIDDFCILSGAVKIGSHVHISAYSALYGKAGIELEDFVTISGRVSIYSINDDYSGEYLTNPTVPEKFTHVRSAPVIIKKHSIIGAGSIVLPGITIGEGVSVGALSLVNRSLDPWKIYAGVPCQVIKNRKKNLLDLEKKF
jgi:acetyltransferase-like isoleucine patch superfamily enzyme